MQDLKPNFDRMGRAESQSLFRWIVRFGAKSTGGALLRYLLVIMRKSSSPRLLSY